MVVRVDLSEFGEPRWLLDLAFKTSLCLSNDLEQACLSARASAGLDKLGCPSMPYSTIV